MEQQKKKISIVYVTRHLNKGGYLILKHLISEQIGIAAVVMHNKRYLLNVPLIRQLVIGWYLLKCRYYRCRPLRSLHSEYLLAKKNRIPVLSVDSMKDPVFIKKLRVLAPDLVLLGGGWHELIPKEVFSIPEHGTINIHPSLLPAFRGTSITRWQVLHGTRVSGSTVHYINEKFDEGGIIAQQGYEINGDITPQELFIELSRIGAPLITGVINTLEAGDTPVLLKKDESIEGNAYFRQWRWSMDLLRINWSVPFVQIHQFVMANTQESYEFPGPWFIHRGKKYALRITTLHHLPKGDEPEERFSTKGIYVSKIKDGSVFLTRNGEKILLELVQLQRFDRFYPFRRGCRSRRFLKLRQGDLFIHEEQ